MAKLAKKKPLRKLSMKKAARSFKTTTKNKRRMDIWVISILAVLFVTSLVVTNTIMHQQQESIHAAGVSPMLFGTNLTLNDANDQFLTSAQTRTLLQQIHVTTVRMPIRSVGAPSAAEIQAAQDIKAINAIPLVILKYTQTDPVGAGISVVQAMNQVFGNSPVYYEFGNERDLAGVDQTAYTNTWNQDIPKIKAAATNGKFGGPVNFQANASYIAYFVQNANPTPDFISWHEYTCGNTATGATCIANIAHWATHIASIKSAIQATGKTVPPMFVTEWNYDPNYPAGDTRPTAAFEQQFTQTALQELAKDGVTAAYHFVVTGSSGYQLVDASPALTAEGQAFGQMYTQLTGSTGQNTSAFSSGASGSSSSSIVPSFVCGGTTNGICPTITPTPATSGSSSSSSPLISPNSVPSSTQTIPSSLNSLISSTPNNSGNAVCSSSSKQACGYTDDCKGQPNGAICERLVNGCNKDSSGNNIYICKNGKWIYDHWVNKNDGACHFCGGGSNSSDNNSNSIGGLLQELLNLILEFLKKLGL